MKKLILSVLAHLLLIHFCVAQHPGAKMHLLSPYFSFKEKGTPLSTLEKINPNGVFIAGKKEDGFTIRMQVHFRNVQQEQSLIEITGILSLKVKQADPGVRNKQNYPAFAMSDGAVPVLEATLTLTSPLEKVFNRDMTIGCPVAALKNPWGEHEVVLNFTGVRWTMYVDGELMDNDFAIGYPNFGDDNNWQLIADDVSQASIFFPAVTAQRDTTKQSELTPGLQYWTPRGHNAWVGDVATLYYGGRYHVFYLFDRRHHGSKFGVGGHYFEHFSTADFKTWTEHEAAVPIENQWETIGTGTPFVLNNKMNIAYGLHTSRIFPDEKTMTFQQKAYYEKNGKTGAFPFDLTKGYPSGASYAVSQNGIDNFTKSNILFHYCENPSVYVDQDGSLKMIANFRAKGMWASDKLDSGWHSINTDFPPGGDCTFYFHWGKFDYIIGGFVNLWRKRADAGDDGWVDMVQQGLDFYNGINVPAITQINDGRYLMAGWFPIRGGWGGPFVVHELIQLPDGRIRAKWMKELIPAATDTVMLAKNLEKAASFPVTDSCFILSFDVYPAAKTAGKLAVSFLGSGQDEYKKACEFQFDAKSLTAQYSAAVKGTFASPEQSLRQGGEPQSVGNYAIEHVTGTQKPFSVRILVKNNAKLGGSIVDAEIAGQNTMISYRQDLIVQHISFQFSDFSIRNVRVMKIQND